MTEPRSCERTGYWGPGAPDSSGCPTWPLAVSTWKRPSAPFAVRLANKTCSPIGSECGRPGTGVAALVAAGLDRVDELGIDDVAESVAGGDSWPCEVAPMVAVPAVPPPRTTNAVTTPAA